MSVEGGVHTAFGRGTRTGCTTMQVFVKNNTRWAAKALTPDDIDRFKAAQAETAIAPVIAHASYLINLCAANPMTLRQSRNAFEDELLRCGALGIPVLVFHPGSHVGAGEAAGLRLIAESLDIIHDRTPDCPVLSTLETTAGQGTTLGYRFEHLAEIIARVRAKKRMAVCLDTCHVFAAGYDIRTEEGWNAMAGQCDDVIGLGKLAAVHVNDSLKPLGSRVDRHQHIGKGAIGATGFRMLMNDTRFRSIPKILETPKQEDMREDIENLEFLRSLIAPPAVP